MSSVITKQVSCGYSRKTVFSRLLPQISAENPSPYPRAQALSYRFMCRGLLFGQLLKAAPCQALTVLEEAALAASGEEQPDCSSTGTGSQSWGAREPRRTQRRVICMRNVLGWLETRLAQKEYIYIYIYIYIFAFK